VLGQSNQQYLRSVLGEPERLARRGIEQLLSGQIGGDIVPAIQQNAALGFGRIKSGLQQQGQRFASATGQQIADAGIRLNADTNLAIQQALQQNANRRVSELIGAGQLSNQMGGNRIGALNARNPQLMAAFELGTGPAMIKEEGSWLGNALNFASQAASIVGSFIAPGAVQPQMNANGNTTIQAQFPTSLTDGYTYGQYGGGYRPQYSQTAPPPMLTSGFVPLP
jgi:hypothetical protein